MTFTKFTPTVPTGWLAPGGVPRFANGRFLATAINLTTLKSGYLGSADGVAWTPIGYYNEAPTPPPGQSRLYFHSDLAYGNGKYIIAGIDQAQTISTKTSLPLLMVLDESLVPATPTAPAISAQPVATAAVVGRSATLSVTATGTGNTYQWRKDNAAIAGATAATYTIASVTAASAGNYSVVVSNSVGNLTSSVVALSIVTADRAGRLINLSVLTEIAAAGDSFTLGYVVGGANTSGVKPLVIRAAGPSLGALGVPGTLADPKLETFAGTLSTGGNDDWGGSASLTTALAGVGAFAYTGPTSKDAAVSANILSRDNSVAVSGVGPATGKVIAEVYDATPAASFAATTPRLLNVSVRKELGTGLTAGFVLGGTTPTRVLIRVVGPGLAAFGVGGTVADPQLTLFAGSAKIGENNDWGGGADLTAAFTSVGAFA
ncbi:MAG: immunoglobulin domain-containing protein, partial [Verrucomicrobia bacterium]|nr:immunoglobulin domain-containing protein [Verrucomicrobiota bacterium]